MENNIDKLFREGLSKKETPFNEKAWNRLSLPLAERKRRVAVWWWLGLAVLLLGLIAWGIFIKEDNQIINEPVKKEFASQTNKQNEDRNMNPEKELDSELLTNTKKDDEWSSNENHRNEAITNLDSKERQKTKIQTIADIDKTSVEEEEVYSELAIDKSTMGNEVEMAEDIPVAYDEKVMESREYVEISPIHNPVLYLNDNDLIWERRDSDEYPIEPLQGKNSWVISGLAEASQVGRLGGGITLSWKGSNRIFFRSALLYNYQSEDDRLIAVESVASYGFGRSISNRQFRSQQLHIISFSLDIGLSDGSWMGYGGVRVNYLSGVRGVVSLDSESSISTVHSWMKEYGYNRFSMDLETGLMKKVGRHLDLGIRLGYPMLSKYNVTYFSNNSLQLENYRAINVSLQLQYDLVHKI